MSETEAPHRIETCVKEAFVQVRRSSWFFCALLVAGLLRPEPAGGESPAGVVERIWSRLGGRSAYEKARFVEFTWAVERDGRVVGARHHLWDRHTGSYVLGARDKESGDSLQVYLNVTSKRGSAYRNGEPLPEEESLQRVEDAYAAHINDTYWLLCPAKLEDPGVTLAMTSEDSLPGVSVLHLRFENVGLTPGDQYWLYVDGDGRILKWRYLLESGREGIHDWRDEKDCGMGLRFATNKVGADGKVRILFPEVRFAAAVDEKRFLPPAR
jgi:hypothetical protein